MEILEIFEKNLQNNLIKFCSEKKRPDGNTYLDGKLLESEDINAKWNDIIESYLADAIKEIAQYPNVSVGWAMYLGMGIAKYWDTDWETYSKHPNLYEHIRDIRGFDYMDEVIRIDLLGMQEPEFSQCEDFVRECGEMTINFIRHEQIDPQSPIAYYSFARSVKVMYKIGAAVELKKLGYNYEKVNM